MKERERWRPEEDCLLRAYVKKYGAGEWNLVSQRMNKALDRDAKSCEERWKNYLKPGIKKGSLSEEEQRLVINLQAKYGNKWKKIAAQVPGRTAKRLGKWWEVYKEKHQSKDTEETSIHSANLIGEGNKYHHILETFAEKYMKNHTQFISPINYSPPSITVAMPPPPLSLNFPTNTIPIPDFINLPTPNACSSVGLTSARPPWMSSGKEFSVSSSYTSSDYSASPSHSSPSVTLSLSPSLSSHVAPAPKNAANEITEASAREKTGIHVDDLGPNRQSAAISSENVMMQRISTFFEHCKELEERQQSWLKYKKEACWRLKRLQDQLESEKARKRREKIEEIESKVWILREEEKMYLDRLEKDYRDQIARLHKDEELKEARMMEMWTAQHVQLTKLLEQMVHRH